MIVSISAITGLVALVTAVTVPKLEMTNSLPRSLLESADSQSAVSPSPVASETAATSEQAPQPGNERIIGGSFAFDGQYPYLASLEMNWGRGTGLCGGTIIADSVIVTAAHCVMDLDNGSIIRANRISVGVGSVDKSRQRFVRGSAVYVHPRFDPNDIINDIAVIVTSSMGVGNGNVQRIPVYGGDISPGTRLTALGWGQTGTNPNIDSTTNRLKHADIVVGMRNDCSRFIRGYESSNGPQICTENRFLLGDDTCQGDSGTGVVINANGRQYLAGFTSYGANLRGDPTCALNDGFGVYTHVNYYLGFISSVTGIPAGNFR
ncbi:hypothetical protein FBU59_005706 [Linderina macrospora]|uniref:Uncharacterized protein n=1 Tax=Linderina macrospora TaxID=4868 RepID=A0ACC1J1T6_9FUNG|nr:hypothetical protein FBU59_005706 [Linderina macrospora]